MQAVKFWQVTKHALLLDIYAKSWWKSTAKIKT